MKSFDRRKKKKKLNYKNRILSILLVSVMVLGILPRQAYSAEYISNSEIVDIKDKNLEKALKEEIKKINPEYNSESISKEDLKLIVDIDLSNKGIKSLEGIENAENLKSINLEGNSISDISLLGFLSKLEKYNISNQTIYLDLGSVDKSEIEFENMLVNTNGSKIASVSGDDIYINAEKVVISNLIDGENKKLATFNSNTEKGEFSGKIAINIISELKEEVKENVINIEKEDLKQLEVEKNTEENSKITKAQLRPNPSSNIDLRGEFIVSAYGQGFAYQNHEITDNSSIIKKYIDKNYIKITDEGLGRYQNVSITSMNKVDFSKSFRMSGKLNQCGFEYADGVVFAFHNQEGYKFGGGYSSNLGVYNGDNKGLSKSALVLEYDAWGNNRADLGDAGLENSAMHLGINKINPGKNPTVIETKILPKDRFQSPGIYDFEVSWDALNKIIKLRYGDYEVSKKIPNIEEIVGGQEAYYTIGGAAGVAAENGTDKGLITELTYDEFKYVDLEVDNSIEYYKELNGKEVPIESSEQIKEEDTIIVKHKFYNRKNTNEFVSNICLEKNNFREKKLSMESDSNPKWYTPYIIEDSFKSYVENSVVDNNINAKKFFDGDIVNVSIPRNSKVRIIEYKVKMPKVLGESTVKLEQVLRIGTPGMENNICIDFRNAIGVKEESIKDINLKNGLITNIMSKITEEKPTELDGKIYRKELEVLDVVNLSNLGISNLSGLEKCTNAVEINLSSNNDITDVSVLSKISKLKSLNLSNNTKISKDSLGQLLNLDTLLMDNSNIDDEYTDGIGKLTNLKKLSLKNNKISNLNNLSSLKSLNEFYLDNNKIYDLRPIYNQVENAKKNNNKYSIKKQSVDIDRRYINSGIFELENIVYNTKNVESNVTDISNEGEYDLYSDKIVWRNISEGEHALDYDWFNNDFRFSGKVNIKLNQVPGPDYLVTIPASLDMGDVLDENSSEYDPEIDKTSINYKPDKEVTKKNPIVSGMVGAKDIISIVSDDDIIGNVNIYTDSVFTMKNIEDGKDTTLVDVYKTFDDKLNGTASSKEDVLMSLNNTNRKSVFRIKSPTSRFKDNNAGYKGTMNFIIEHVK